MERMKIRLISVTVRPREGLAVARAQAVSARKLRGKPVATIGLEVRLRVPAGEPLHITRQRARDAAVDFLDVM